MSTTESCDSNLVRGLRPHSFLLKTQRICFGLTRTTLDLSSGCAAPIFAKLVGGQEMIALCPPNGFLSPFVGYRAITTVSRWGGSLRPWLSCAKGWREILAGGVRERGQAAHR